MKGHQQLIAMRRGGHRPVNVHLCAFPVHGFLTREWHVPIHNDAATYATVEVEDSDNISRLDLRFLVGMTVIVDGSESARVEELTRAVSAAGAGRIITHRIGPDGLQTVTDSREAACG